jgi:TonB-dependent SusC/RagA subfamily outer membrane receptor
MLRSLLKFLGPSRLAITLLAGVFVGFVSGCGQQTANSEGGAAVAPKQDQPSPSATSSQEVQKRPHETIETLLNARTNGAIVHVNSDRSLSIQIRGAQSVNSGTQPLFVVDGVPVPVGPGGTIAGVNPYEIQSIRVLKGPPETTLYGVRGANGVILITTKGHKP